MACTGLISSNFNKKTDKDNIPLAQWLSGISQSVLEFKIEEFINIDSVVITREVLTDEEIINSVVQK